MAGRGPQPKDPDQRARRNKDPIPMRVLQGGKHGQPDLPEFMGYRTEFRPVEGQEDREGIEVGIPWPSPTVAWWAMWGESPLAEGFIAADWSFLLDTALLHAAVWRGDTKAAAELRLRVAKFGQTPEDRARLRITFASAGSAEEKQQGATPTGGGSRERRGAWVPGQESAGGA